MAKAVTLGVLGLLAIAASACASPGNSSSAPTTASSSPRSTTRTVPPRTNPATLLPATAAEIRLLQDLSNVKSAGQTASAWLTTASANQATGSGNYSVSQVSATVFPVILYLAAAINHLNAVMPTLPTGALLSQAAQLLSSSISVDLQTLRAEAELIQEEADAGAVPGLSPSVGSALSTYAVSAAVSGYTEAVGLVNETFSSGLASDFVKSLSLVVAVPGANN
jgi:hypothetical protein